MSKSNIIRTAFNTLAEAYLIESNKARKAELRALRAKHNLPGSNPASAEIGHRAGKTIAAYKSPWTPAGSKGVHQGITDLAKEYGKKAKNDPKGFSQSSGEIDQYADTRYKAIERAEKGEPTSFTKGIKRGILTGRNILQGVRSRMQPQNSSTNYYRAGLKALFESVIEEADIYQPDAAKRLRQTRKMAKNPRNLKKWVDKTMKKNPGSIAAEAEVAGHYRPMSADSADRLTLANRYYDQDAKEAAERRKEAAQRRRDDR